MFHETNRLNLFTSCKASLAAAGPFMMMRSLNGHSAASVSEPPLLGPSPVYKMTLKVRSHLEKEAMTEPVQSWDDVITKQEV